MSPRLRLSALLATLAIALSGLGFAAYIKLQPAHPQAIQAVALRNPAPILDTPSGAELAQVAPTPAPATEPVYTQGVRVEMPRLGINLPVVPGDGVNVPLYAAAVYPAPLSWPGQGKRSMLYAHARAGMFGPLWNAQIGDTISVDEPDGKVLKYKITEYYPHWPATDLSVLQPVDHEQLILLTCTGWNATDPRVIAVAEPV